MAVQVSLLLSEVITLGMTELHTDLHWHRGARGVTFDHIIISQFKYWHDYHNYTG